jgi:hypothetical protein
MKEWTRSGSLVRLVEKPPKSTFKVRLGRGFEETSISKEHYS